MEKDLDIAKILETKSVGTKLYSPIIGECQYYTIFGSNILVNNKDGVVYSFSSEGRFIDDVGECLLFPSKSMRDWSKFAWKKGDVLVSNGEYIIFEKWANNAYTTFIGVFDSIDNNFLLCFTSAWEKETNEVQINKYISQIEKDGGGKLNLETLEIDKPSEFKDGDILVVNKCNQMSKGIIIFDEKSQPADFSIQISISAYAFYDVGNNILTINDEVYVDGRKLRYATDSEKQQLFTALAKKGKRWNSETKTLVDLPKKCEFKPFDKVLVKHEVEYEWMIDFFSHYDKDDEMPFVCMTGRAVKCIPYNDKTAHLLGTTDGWKGGEG